MGRGSEAPLQEELDNRGVSLCLLPERQRQLRVTGQVPCARPCGTGGRRLGCPQSTEEEAKPQ